MHQCQLIACGCSWANGAELKSHESPVGAIVAQELGAEYIHRAQDAASIPHMVLQLRSAIEMLDPTRDTIAIFLLTSPDRDLMWSRTRPIGTGHLKTNPPPYDTPQAIFLNGNDPLHHDWFREYHSFELAKYRANVSILALQSLCRFHGIRDYYAWGFDRIDLWPEISVDRFYKNGDYPMDDEFRHYRSGHPNQEHHRLMAQEFAHMIKNS